MQVCPQSACFFHRLSSGIKLSSDLPGNKISLFGITLKDKGNIESNLKSEEESNQKIKYSLK